MFWVAEWPFMFYQRIKEIIKQGAEIESLAISLDRKVKSFYKKVKVSGLQIPNHHYSQRRSAYGAVGLWYFGLPVVCRHKVGVVQHLSP